MGFHVGKEWRFLFLKRDFLGTIAAGENFTFSTSLFRLFSEEKKSKFDTKHRLVSIGARVYITGRRMEVLEQAAKTHSPEGGGEIIP